MKQIVLIAMILILAISLQADPKLVGTFATVGFTDWNPADQNLLMTTLPNGVYSKTISMIPGTYQYKVVEGDSWVAENYPSNNQQLVITQTTNITWKCNPTANLVMHKNPTVAGNFISQLGGTDWNSSDPIGAMIDPEGDDIWTWTGVVPSGSWQFKVTLNDTWDQSTTPNNVSFVSDGIAQTQITYNFITNTVTTNSALPPSATVTISINDQASQSHTNFSVRGSWNTEGSYIPSFGNPPIVGTASDDGLNGDLLANDHIFTYRANLVSDGGSSTWEWAVNDENQQPISTVMSFTVPNGDPIALTYTVPGGTTQPVTVTFSVNTWLQEPITSVTLAGSFNQWSTTSTPMSQVGTSHVYSTTVVYPSGSLPQQSYKFVVNGNFESIDNRTFQIDDTHATQVLPEVYFNEQAPIVLQTVNFVPGPSSTYTNFINNAVLPSNSSILLEASTSPVDVAATSGHIVTVHYTIGTGLEQTRQLVWDHNDNDLAYWRTSFVNGTDIMNNQSLHFYLTASDITGNTVTDNNLGNQYAVSISEQGTSQTVSVTFAVNMALYPSAQLVELAGSFDNWVSTVAMTDSDNNGIYTGTINYPAGSAFYQEYKFKKDGEWENIINNRSFNLIDTNPTQIMDPVYFSNFIPTEMTGVSFNPMATSSFTNFNSGDMLNMNSNPQIEIKVSPVDSNANSFYTATLHYNTGTIGWVTKDFSWVSNQDNYALWQCTLTNGTEVANGNTISFYITATDYNGPLFTDNNNNSNYQVSISTVQANEHDAAPAVQIANYPNPMVNQATLFIRSPRQTSVQASLYNMKGQRVGNICDTVVRSGETNITWKATDLGMNLSNGVYFIKVQMNNQTHRFKILLVR